MQCNTHTYACMKTCTLACTHKRTLDTLTYITHMHAHTHTHTHTHTHLQDKLCFVMDFVNGGELYTHISREKKFSEEKARFYAGEVILAIEYLHEMGVIYRDLKPENVLVDCEGHLKLTDFGQSKHQDSSGKRSMSMVRCLCICMYVCIYVLCFV